MWLATWIWISRSFSKVIWHLMHWYVFFCSETEKIYILDSQEGGTGRKQSFPEVAAPDYPEGLWSPPGSPQDILSLPAFEPSSPAWGKTGGGAGRGRGCQATFQRCFSCQAWGPCPTRGAGTQRHCRTEAEGGGPAQVCPPCPPIHLHAHTHPSTPPSVHPPIHLYRPPVHPSTQACTHTQMPERASTCM